MAENRRELYGEDEIIWLEFEGEERFECGVMGVFEVAGKEYIALEALDETDDVYLYGYKENGDEFELLDIETEQEYEQVELEFYRLMDEPL